MTKFVVNEFSTSLFVRSLFSFFDVTMFAAEGEFKLARESFPYSPHKKLATLATHIFISVILL